VLETEFNKGGIESYQPFDAELASVARRLKRRSNVKVVLAFGNWGRENWRRFERAVDASDLVGTQLLRSSVRDAESYDHAIDTLFEGVQSLRSFHKPLMVVDLAVSSYPARTFELRQASVTRELGARMADFRAAGVRAILYRMVSDDPTFDISNYHGVAERHWGLLRADGSEKPAFAAFAATVRAESR
jgi:hypothetical protein